MEVCSGHWDGTGVPGGGKWLFESVQSWDSAGSEWLGCWGRGAGAEAGRSMRERAEEMSLDFSLQTHVSQRMPLGAPPRNTTEGWQIHKESQ